VLDLGQVQRSTTGVPGEHHGAWRVERLRLLPDLQQEL